MEEIKTHPGWVVLVSDGRVSPQLVARNLKGAGYRPYLPMRRAVLRGHRIVDGHRIRTRGAGEIVERPVMGRYLFAEHWGTNSGGMAYVRGVSRLLQWADGRPQIAPDSQVQKIRDLVASGELDDVRPGQTIAIRPDLRKLLDEGKTPTVRVPEWANMTARLIAMNDNGRAELLLEIALGRGEVKATTNANTLEVVSA